MIIFFLIAVIEIYNPTKVFSLNDLAKHKYNTLRLKLQLK